MKYNVGDIVQCYASVTASNPEICGIVDKSNLYAALYEFTIIGQRGPGCTSHKYFILLVPDIVPSTIGWIADRDWLADQPHYHVPGKYVDCRVIGCDEDDIVGYAPIHQASISPIILTNKEKELCETIDLLEKELKEKDQTISKLKEQLARDWLG